MSDIEARRLALDLTARTVKRDTGIDINANHVATIQRLFTSIHQEIVNKARQARVDEMNRASMERREGRILSRTILSPRVSRNLQHTI